MTKPDLMAELAACAFCGMPCDPGEYHPYAACLMFKACGNSQAVYSNLQAVQDYALRTHHAELEAVAMKAVPASELAALLPGVYYMDPPDGGDVSVIEQLRRMAKDAARYRHIKLAPPMHYHFGSGKALDAAIDHAMHNSAREG